MNKKSILLGVLIVLVVSLATGCLFYNVLEDDDFKEHFGALGYTISENTESDLKAEKKLKATKDDVPYEILYFEFEAEVDAKKAYKNYYDNIKDYITSTSNNTETTGAVFSKTVAVSEKEYIVISRVKNTLIFIAGTKDYTDEINTLLEDIDY